MWLCWQVLLTSVGQSKSITAYEIRVYTGDEFGYAYGLIGRELCHKVLYGCRVGAVHKVPPRAPRSPGSGEFAKFNLGPLAIQPVAVPWSRPRGPSAANAATFASVPALPPLPPAGLGSMGGPAAFLGCPRFGPAF